MLFFFCIWIFGTLALYTKYSLYVYVLENIKWSHHLSMLTINIQSWVPSNQACTMYRYITSKAIFQS